ncbi:VOC family protein [Streptomyces sp. NPDC005322]|uniref:VOC family protein n=1 Tax=unclassified Streptomyces TaxID=2593676 RepID=UPI0033A48D6D
MAYLNPVRHITFDAHDPYALARFWSRLTGYALEDSAPGDDEVLIVPDHPGVPGLLFLRVPDPKPVKNRVHLDIQPPSGTRDGEVERLVGLGARVVDDRRTEGGMGWVVMADIEGNEFCVERSAVERGLVPS